MATFDEMLEAFLSAGPRQQRAAANALRKAVMDDPKHLLPRAESVREESRATIADLEGLQLSLRKDVAGLVALVERLPPTLAWRVVHSLGNGRARADFVAVAAHALAIDDPDVRHAALYFFGQHVGRDGADVSAHAAALAGLVGDERVGTVTKKKVSSTAQVLLRAARLGARSPEAFDEAVAALAPSAKKRAKSAVAAIPSPPKTLASAIAMLSRDVESRRSALRWLHKAVAMDVKDVRASYVRVGELLGDEDVEVRRLASALVVTVLEEGALGPIRSAGVDAQLRARSNERDTATRQNVERALAILAR